MNVDKAVAFLRQNGTDFDKARLEWIVNKIKPDDSIVAPFLELQRADGGFPFGGNKNNLSTVDSTLSRNAPSDFCLLFKRMMVDGMKIQPSYNINCHLILHQVICARDFTCRHMPVTY